MLFNKKAVTSSRERSAARAATDSRLPALARLRWTSAPAASRAQSAAATQSVIDAWLTISGNLESEGDVRVEGQMHGDIRCAHLVVGRDATVSGDIVAEEAVVRGKVKGSIRANRVILQDTACVESDIYHKVLSVDEGASFDGQSCHRQQPFQDGRGGRAGEGAAQKRAAVEPVERQPMARSRATPQSLAHELFRAPAGSDYAERSVPGMTLKPSSQRAIRPMDGEGKCTVHNRVELSQKRSSILRLDSPACDRIVVGAHAELGIARLQRRVDHVAGDQGVLPRLCRRAPRSGRWCGPGVGISRTSSLRAWSLFTVSTRLAADDRQHRVGDPGMARRIGLLLLGPVRQLAVGEQVLGLREGRHPAAVVEPGVPADMIDVQVRAHDVVDVVHAEPGGGEVLLVAVARHHVPDRPGRTRLVVADAGVDQDVVMRRAHDVALDAQDELAGRRSM